MAIQLTTSEQKISTGTLSRDGCNFELKTYAWYRMESSTTARVYVKMTIQCQSGFTWSGTNNYYRCWSDGKFDTGSVKRTANVTSTKTEIGTWSYTKTTSGENTINSYWAVYGGQYSTTVSAAVYVPNSAFYVAPSTPSVSASRGKEQNTITYSVSSYGNPSSGTIYLYGGTSTNPTTQIASASGTGSKSFTHTGLSQGTTYYYRARANNGSGWGDYSSNASAKTYSSPPVPSISISSRTTNQVVVSYGLNSFGDPNSGTVYLYGGTSSNPTSQIASKTSTGSSNYTYTGLSANQTYYFRTRAANGQYTTSYSGNVSTTTACPTPTALSLSSETYTAYNRVSTVYSVTRASDNGSATRTGYYRISTNGGSSWGSWTSFGTLPNNQYTTTFTVSNVPTASSIKIQVKINNGMDSGIKELSYTSKATHVAPNFSNFTYLDSNPTTVVISGDNQVMIQGQSTPQITVSAANKATGNDGIAVSNYAFSFSGRSDTATWSSSADVVKTLGTPQNSGSQTMTVSAVDALSLSKAVNKNVQVYPWKKPVIVASIARLNNFEADSTLKISGTWAAINIGGTDKNSLSVAFRYKPSSTSSWDAWITRPITTSGDNYSATDLVISLDNTKQWDIQVRATDAFTTETISLVLPAGQPLFFIGTDGRISIADKPSHALLTNEKGLLDVKGRVITNDVPVDNQGSNGFFEALNSNATDTYYLAKRSDTGTSVGFGVGSGGYNHGIWSMPLNKWILVANRSNNRVEVNGVDFSWNAIKTWIFTTTNNNGYIGENANLNSTSYINPGVYYCSVAATGATQTNNPSGTAYQMRVINLFRSDYTTSEMTAWTYLMRIMLALNGIWYQTLNNGSSGTSWSYSSWTKLG